MSKQFTPGPWRHSRDEFEDWGVVRGGPADLPIAKCFLGYSGAELEVHRLNGTDPLEANARLIAAAPDLLEACKALVKWCETGDGKPLDSEDEMDKEWQMAVAAIAKAGGA